MLENAEELLAAMRELRRKAVALNRTVADDHRPFFNPHDKRTFFRLPSKPPDKADGVNVTPTCTALMALAVCDSFKDVYSPQDPTAELDAAMKELLAAPWDTAKLRANNSFTTTLVLRTGGLLHRAGQLTDGALETLKRTHKDIESQKESKAEVEIPDDKRKLANKTLRCIAKDLVKLIPESLRVQSYPAAPTIAYWLLDATQMLGVMCGEDESEAVVVWASREFYRQVSLVSSGDHAHMDPIALAMSACVCRVIRRLSTSSTELRSVLSTSEIFPTNVELRSAIGQFLDKQNDAGVWEKYFPIFHYPGAGPNHCWHFEVLEAVLNEFPEILRSAANVDKISASLTWLQNNRLDWRGSADEFHGWNSGGDFVSLRTGQPESWPTSAAHVSCTT